MIEQLVMLVAAILLMGVFVCVIICLVMQDRANERKDLALIAEMHKQRRKAKKKGKRAVVSNLAILKEGVRRDRGK